MDNEKVYFITVNGRRRIIGALEDALAVANEIFRQTGIMVGIEELSESAKFVQRLMQSAPNGLKG